jgi:coenzyme F420-dependent glucose-6-phosphate dehydrogenase
MAHVVTLSWKAAPEQYPPVELLGYAIMAEQAGFDSIEVSDHFQPWSEAGQACFTWTWLGAVAAKTNKIQIGTGVTCPILRYHPAIIAQAAATVSHFAPNRSYLSVGTGEALNDYAATGMWPDYAERQARLAEAIDLIRTLWTGREVTHDGPYYQTRKAKLYTPPATPIPLYISTMTPGSATFAGQHSDGLITVGGQEPGLYRQIMTNFEAGAKEQGKDPSQLPRLIELSVAYTDDWQAAIEYRKKYWAATHIPALFTQKIYTPKMAEWNGAAVGSDTIEKKLCISVNPDDHVRFAQRYIDLGFDHLIFHSAGPDQHAFLEGYGRDVLPRIRQQAEGSSQGC